MKDLARGGEDEPAAILEFLSAAKKSSVRMRQLVTLARYLGYEAPKISPTIVGRIAPEELEKKT